MLLEKHLSRTHNKVYKNANIATPPSRSNKQSANALLFTLKETEQCDGSRLPILERVSRCSYPDIIKLYKKYIVIESFKYKTRSSTAKILSVYAYNIKFLHNEFMWTIWKTLVMNYSR